VGGVHEHGGKGEERRRLERRQAAAQDAVEGEAGRRQPSRERNEVGRERERQIDQERRRRIEERGVAELRSEQRLLSRPMSDDVIGEIRAAIERQSGSGVKADEIGADRLALMIEAARRERDPADGAEERDGEQNARVGARRRARRNR
jgi:hypothetical protein